MDQGSFFLHLSHLPLCYLTVTSHSQILFCLSLPKIHSIRPPWWSAIQNTMGGSCESFPTSSEVSWSFYHLPQMHFMARHPVNVCVIVLVMDTSGSYFRGKVSYCSPPSESNYFSSSSSSLWCMPLLWNRPLESASSDCVSVISCLECNTLKCFSPVCGALVSFCGLSYMADSAGCLYSPLWSCNVQPKRGISGLLSTADSLWRPSSSEGKWCQQMTKKGAVTSSEAEHTGIIINWMLKWS